MPDLQSNLIHSKFQQELRTTEKMRLRKKLLFEFHIPYHNFLQLLDHLLQSKLNHHKFLLKVQSLQANQYTLQTVNRQYSFLHFPLRLYW